MNQILNRIDELRNQRGVSQNELAKLIGVSANAVYHWRKTGALPTLANIEKICEVFGITVEQFFHGLDSSVFTDDVMATDWVLFDESSGSVAQAADKAHAGLASEGTYNAIDFYYTLCNALRTGVAQYVYCFQSTALGHFMRAAQTISDYHFQIKVVAQYNGETHETIGSVKFNEASLTIPVQSVTVSKDLIF